MDERTLKKLEYDKIKAHLRSYAMSYLGRLHVDQLQPSDHLRGIESRLRETFEARKIIEHGSSVPIPSLDGIEQVMSHLKIGYMLGVPDIAALAQYINSCCQLKNYMLKKESISLSVAAYARDLHELTELTSEIERCIRNGQISDQASPELEKVRKRLRIVDERIRQKLESLMLKHRAILQENLISIRNDKYVIPVRKEFRKQIKGNILGESSSGQTVFIEPEDIALLHLERSGLRAEESFEEDKVLGNLTALAVIHMQELENNLEIVGHYDFLFAKAKYARAIGGTIVKLNDRGEIDLRQGRHPLLASNPIPLDFSIGVRYKAMIITGPNTGGKTLALKTVGLLTLMAQSGLLVPAGNETKLSVYREVLADIGDGQSIEQSLSTFSSHVTNIIRILQSSGRMSLVLLDELATGTDPGEGIGLSIAVLERLYASGATVIATTHYNEIKWFAKATRGFENARMEFDVATLQPLYKLTIGEAGSSYAFMIAQKLGMPSDIIARSRQITAGGENTAILSAPHPNPVGNPTVPLTESDAAAANNATDSDEGSQPVPNANDAEISDTEKSTSRPLQIGDCVFVRYLNRTGIVCSEADNRGMVTVMIKKEKLKINAKRLTLHIERERLYPADYDMNIVLESKQTRKKLNLMKRKHVEGLLIERKEDES